MSGLNIDKFVSDQLSVWPLASDNFRALKNTLVRDIKYGGLTLKLQFNPCRITSSTASIDKDVIAARRCFLCKENRQPEQMPIRVDARKGRAYNIQVNPFPIFQKHLVIVRDTHVPQSIEHCFVDMLDLTRKLGDYTIFYNGPCSGASAPDHMHFQACPKGLMPLELAVDAGLTDAVKAREEGRGHASASLKYLSSIKDSECYLFTGFIRGVFALRARTVKSLAKMFYRLTDCAPVIDGEYEPRFNLFAWTSGNDYRAMVVFRSQLRSHHFFAEGDEHLSMTFGCADMGGFIVAPCREDYDKFDESRLESLLSEISLSAEDANEMVWRMTRTQPTVEVGIMSAPRIRFEMLSDGCGVQTVTCEDGRINYNGALYDELYFDAMTPASVFAEPSFVLEGVTIGKDFHWQRQQVQKFAGSLRFFVEDGKVTAVNRIGIEDYLLSVISSEMKASASLELLKAHAIISRSWVMTNMHTHEHYDVCADDHCQRYQGLRQNIGEGVRKAVEQTWGQVITYDGKICDARYSKCCGGVTEAFSTCWEDIDVPYLVSLDDRPADGGDPYCKTDDTTILSQVLNDYDLETRDFYEWEQRYTTAELSDLAHRRTGIDFGEITDLRPLERGGSGRIKYIEIAGTKETRTIGKELAIRHALSESHLKSSAFEVEHTADGFVLRGKGWGHGVGLCQIGAAVMAFRGIGHAEILQHYYPGTKIERV